MTEPQPTNVETSRQNIIGRMAILYNVPVDKKESIINMWNRLTKSAYQLYWSIKRLAAYQMMTCQLK